MLDCLILICFILASSIAEETEESAGFIVSFKHGISESEKNSIIAYYGDQVTAVWPEIDSFYVSPGVVHGSSLRDSLLSNNVEFESDAILTSHQSEAPNWNIDRIDQTSLPLDGRPYSPIGNSKGRGVNVYVVDSGTSNTAIQFGNSDLSDCYGHGSAVESVINDVAPEASVVGVKVLDCDGNTRVSSVVSAIYWVLQQDLNVKSVINLSLGARGRFGSLARIIQSAVARGVTVVASAGNENHADACDFYPAGAPGVIAVGATDSLDRIAAFSNVGSCVKLYAPGQSIRVLEGNQVWDGTSFSAPHVAAAAAIFLSLNPLENAEYQLVTHSYSHPNGYKIVTVI